MKSLEQLLLEKKNNIDVIPPLKSQRAELFKQLYSYYEQDYKIQTWKEYIKWLKQNKLKHNSNTLKEYSKIAYPKISVSSFCSYWLGFMPTQDLFYLASVMRDFINRKQSCNKWLFFNLKCKNENVSTK